jgi:hypothetical protein
MAAASASTAPQSTATALLTAELVDTPSTSSDADTGRPDRLAGEMRPYAPPPRP